MIPPAEPFDVPDITVCGVTYSVGATFATQADLLSLLNGSLVPTFGLLGVFSIDGSNELIYTTSETCTGDNCVTVVANARITEDGLLRITEDGQQRIIE